MALDLNNIQSDYLKSEGVFTLKATNKSDLDANTIAYLESSDKHAFLDNGTLVFEDSDGTTQIADSGIDNADVDLSKIDASVLSAAADIAYLAQNTGVKTREMNKSYESLGLDLNDQMAHLKKAAILRAAGYKPGEQADFYGSNTAVDQGAKILSDRWQEAPTEAQISEHNAAIESGEKEGTPITATPVNSYGANIVYVRQELLKNNVDLDSTKATTSLAGVGGGNLSPYGIGGVSNIDEVRALNDSDKEKYGANNPNFKTSDQQLDIFEWDNLFDSPKKEDEIEQPVDTGAVTTGGYNPTTATTSAGTTPVSTAFTPDPNTFEIPTQATQPYYNPSRATTGGTFTQPAETFASNVTKQGTAYSARAPQQAQYYQPQTIQELQAADALQKEKTGTEGTSASAYQLSQKLYRNPSTGHQLYIAFRGESPISPIPQGYYPVSMSGATAGNISLSAYNPVTAGGNTYDFNNSQYMAKGGMIQGYQEGNLVNPPINFKPGGTVKPVDVFNPALNTTEIKFQIQYPGSKDAEGKDIPGGVSQFYNEMTQAEQAQTLGLKNLGIPDYDTYLSNIGVNTSLPGYDPASYTSQYQQYVTDPTNFAKLPAEQTGTVSFQDPVSGQVVSQNVPEYIQTQQNIAAQKTINPASAIAPMGVQYMREVDAAGNLLMPGTVLESTAGQALPTAPMVGGDQIAQVQGITQARGVGALDTQGLLNAYKNKVGESATPLNVRYDATKGKYVSETTDTYGNVTPVAEYTPGEFAQEMGLNLEAFQTQAPGAAQMNLTQAAPAVKADLANLTAAQLQAPIYDEEGKVIGYKSSPSQLISGQTDYTSSVTGLDAATKTSATDVTAPTDRILQRTREPLTTTDAQGNVSVIRDTDGNIMYKGSELISGTGVDQSKVDTAFGTGQVTAASLTGELATLMKDFEGGDTPAWAAGAMRQATAIMNERGLGASTMAGQAIVQAAMESALPIAQVEAGNKQQIALFNGEQRAKFLGIEFDQTFQAKVQNAARVSEIANLNFTAKQTIALENSRAANTVNLADMSNRQAVVMAEAAALSQLDMASLSNLQQAAVQNAQNFLQVDMANLTNSQQTAIFKAQTQSQALLSDTSQANAAAQFNATSENQTTQFMSNLTAQVSQFNAAQQNAINQFNAEEANAVLEFNSALQNQREMFNAQNYLVVAQANAVWRQGINTTNTEAQNLSNAQYAKDVNGLSQQALDNFWQKERDLMNFAFAEDESQKDRALRVLLGEANEAFAREQLDMIEQENKTAFFMDLFLPKDFSLIDISSFGE